MRDPTLRLSLVMREPRQAGRNDFELVLPPEGSIAAAIAGGSFLLPARNRLQAGSAPNTSRNEGVKIAARQMSPPSQPFGAGPIAVPR